MVAGSADFTLRCADEGDVHSLSALSIETWLSTYAKDGVSDEYAQYVFGEFSSDRFLNILKTKAAEILVMRSGAYIGGYALFSAPTDSEMLRHGSVELTTLYVRPSQQRRGLGRTLLANVFSQCRANGASGIFLTVNSENANAIAFYEAMGMSERGEWTFMLGSLAVPNQIFSFRFDPDINSPLK